MPVRNKPGFVPRSFRYQPDYYVELFGRINAVFTHPTKNVTLYIGVDADIWNYANFMDAKGDLLVMYQADDCRRELGRHGTLTGALEQMKKHLSNEHFGESMKHKPVFTTHSAQYANPYLYPKEKKVRRKGNGRRFVLTEEDRNTLAGYGYPSTDFAQIEEAANRSTYTVEPKGENEERKAVNVWEVIDLLGRETFLSGIGRSAFHWNCGRDNPETEVSVYFDSSVLFKNIK